jgi:hypothetical protein
LLAVEVLAERAGAHAPSLHRLLRTLASAGVFTEPESGVPPCPARADTDQQPAWLDARPGYQVHGNALRAVRRARPHHPHQHLDQRSL